MRQPITLHVHSLELFIYDLGQYYFNNEALRSRYQKFIDNLRAFHLICLDRNSSWLKHYQSALETLGKEKYFPGADNISKMISDDLGKFLINNFISLDTESKETENICIEIAEKSSSKILVYHKIMKHKKLRNYTIKEFNERNDKETNLLRKEKVCSFNKGEKINGVTFLEPYIMYTKEISIFDQYLFKCAEDWLIVTLLCRSILNLEKLILGTQFDKHDRNVMKNIEQLKNNFPNTLIKSLFTMSTREK